MILVPEILDPVLKSAGGTSYTLTNAILDYDIDDSTDELVTSVLNGDQAVIEGGDYFRGEIDYHGVSVANYVALKALQRTLCRLWPFGQGSIAGSSPARYYPYVDVIILSVKPYHRNNRLYVDACIISFVSQKYYTLVRAADNGIPVPP